jgi:hypothetical protein
MSRNSLNDSVLGITKLNGRCGKFPSCRGKIPHFSGNRVYQELTAVANFAGRPLVLPGSSARPEQVSLTDFCAQSAFRTQSHYLHQAGHQEPLAEVAPWAS